MSTFLLVGSTEPYSGKSAATLGLASHLQQKGFQVAYGKPVGQCDQTNCSTGGPDPDLDFIAASLGLKLADQPPSILQLDQEALLKQMTDPQQMDYLEPLRQFGRTTSADLVVLEGPGDLREGQLFGLSLQEVATGLEAQVLLIGRYHSAGVVDGLLSAHRLLGHHLAGVLLNDVSPDEMAQVESVVKPFLESRGIPVLGILPSNRILRSISVGELACQLEAEILCCEDRLDLMVEDFAIGAMNVNAALKYFRKSDHKAVITGGDRTDIQLAALETSTLCLILTGRLPLDARIRARAEELEVPILSVDLDTFATIERIERVFGQVRLHETAKVRCIQELMSKNFDFGRLLTRLALTPHLVPSA